MNLFCAYIVIQYDDDDVCVCVYVCMCVCLVCVSACVRVLGVNVLVHAELICIIYTAWLCIRLAKHPGDQ